MGLGNGTVMEASSRYTGTGTGAALAAILNYLSAKDPDSSQPGYQPSTGRKLFMFLLCLVALIGLWVYYWFATK